MVAASIYYDILRIAWIVTMKKVIVDGSGVAIKSYWLVLQMLRINWDFIWMSPDIFWPCP